MAEAFQGTPPCRSAWSGAPEARPRWDCATNCCLRPARPVAEPFPHVVDGFLTLRRAGLVTGYIPLEQAAGSDENTGRNGQGKGSAANVGPDYDAVFEDVAARFPVILSRLGDTVDPVDANTCGATDGG